MEHLFTKLKNQGLTMPMVKSSTRGFEGMVITPNLVNDNDMHLALMLRDGMAAMRPKLNASEWWEVLQAMQRVTLGLLRSPASIYSRLYTCKFTLGFIHAASIQIAVIGDRSTDGTELADLEENRLDEHGEQVAGQQWFNVAGQAQPDTDDFDLVELLYNIDEYASFDWVIPRLKTLVRPGEGELSTLTPFTYDDPEMVEGSNALLGSVLPMLNEQITAYFEAWQKELKTNTGFFKRRDVFMALTNILTEYAGWTATYQLNYGQITGTEMVGHMLNPGTEAILKFFQKKVLEQEITG